MSVNITHNGLQLPEGGDGGGRIRTHGPTNLWLKLRILAKETMLECNTIEFRAFPAAIYSNLVD